jgi:hypothetical protein
VETEVGGAELGGDFGAGVEVGGLEVGGAELGGDIGAGVVVGGLELDVLEYQIEFGETSHATDIDVSVTKLPIVFMAQCAVISLGKAALSTA